MRMVKNLFQRIFFFITITKRLWFLSDGQSWSCHWPLVIDHLDHILNNKRFCRTHAQDTEEIEVKEQNKPYSTDRRPAWQRKTNRREKLKPKKTHKIKHFVRWKSSKTGRTMSTAPAHTNTWKGEEMIVHTQNRINIVNDPYFKLIEWLLGNYNKIYYPMNNRKKRKQLKWRMEKTEIYELKKVFF